MNKCLFISRFINKNDEIMTKKVVYSRTNLLTNNPLNSVSTNSRPNVLFFYNHTQAGNFQLVRFEIERNVGGTELFCVFEKRAKILGLQ